jgi:xanthine dehydrogenase accessory factor
MDWLRAATELRETGQPGVLVTVIAVRGHAPRDAGAKMVVGGTRTWGSIGGGNLEEVAIARARTMITESSTEVSTITTRLNPRERTEFGRQCCGGEVTVLFEPLPARPTVAIFGVVAIIVFAFLGFVTMSYKNVANRHSAKADAWAARHGKDGHEAGHGH